jgi:hypothetical protein
VIYFRNYPCITTPTYFDDLYVFKMGYHFYELVNTLLFGRSRRDFPEYILHHTVTIALIVVSYYTNCLPIGGAVLIVHDFTDIFVSLFKLVVDLTSDKVQGTIIVINLILWVYLRLWFFPIYVIYQYHLESGIVKHPM